MWESNILNSTKNKYGHFYNSIMMNNLLIKGWYVQLNYVEHERDNNILTLDEIFKFEANVLCNIVYMFSIIIFDQSEAYYFLTYSILNEI